MYLYPGKIGFSLNCTETKKRFKHQHLCDHMHKYVQKHIHEHMSRYACVRIQVHPLKTIKWAKP